MPDLRTGLHWAGIRGRARADAGPLLLSALVVLLVSVLAGAVPGLMEQTADAAVRDAVRRAGPEADITVTARWEPDDTPDGRARFPRLAEDVDALRDRALDELGPKLSGMLRPPVASVISPTLKITDGNAPRTLRLAYLSGEGGPEVQWVAGAAPAPTVDGTTEVRWFGPPWRVQVGLSEEAADLLGVRAGALLKVVDAERNPKNVQVSGIFRAVDPADPTWAQAPWLLDPAAGADGLGTTRFGGLLSAESLPDARLAFAQDDMRRTVTFTPDPNTLTWASAREVAATTVTLQARSASSSSIDTTSTWHTSLDSVLQRAGEQVDSASTQAAVLLTGILAGAVLVLLLAADLLVRRRSATLVLARQRGASLTALGVELLLESALTAFAAAGAGCLGAYLIAGGVAWPWVVPVLVAAVAAVPAYGVVMAASATRDRKVPANRSARRWARHTGALRRAAAETTVLAAAIGAVVALRQRGLGSGVPVIAPTLTAVAGAILLVRLMPLLTGPALRWTLRSRRPLAVFGAARAASTSGRALPVIALVTSAALATFALVTASTVDRGLAGGAQEAVGADVRVDLVDDAAASTVEAAERIAAAPGVTAVVTGQVTDAARIIADGKIAPARLVIVDSRAFADLLGDPAVRPVDGPRALVRSSSGALPSGVALEIPQQGAPAVRLTADGVAPPVGGATEVVLVDLAAGVPYSPNTIWANGPGAARAVEGLPAVFRASVAAERRDAPLVSGLLLLNWAAAVFLLVAGLLGFVLAAAAGAPGRWVTLSRLRTLGLTPRQARLVAAGELLPVAAVAAAGGPALGVLVASVTSGPLGLRLLTGQVADPALVMPWPGLVVIGAVFLCAVPVLVVAESAVRRRLRLAEVLRVGGTA
ncbi:membrane protein [Actinoplanes italicus]|nr:membrane protein [Actinoplanes italicus]